MIFSLLFLLLISASTGDSSEVSQKDIIDWIVALTATGIAAGALYYTAASFKAESNAKYALILATLDNELSQIETHPERGAHQRSFLRKRWEYNFLNIVGRIATLTESKKYPGDLIDYFKLEFKWAKHLIENSPDREFRRTNYDLILQICNNKNLEPYDPGDAIWNPA